MHHENSSEVLDPIEIKNKEFRKSLLGYSPHEVILYLDRIAKTWERVRVNEKHLRSQIEQLKHDIDSWQKKERELEMIRAAALEEADKIRSAATDHGKKLLQEARDQVTLIQGKTQEWLSGVIVSLQDTDRRRHVLSAELRKKLEEHFFLLDDVEKHGSPLDEQLSEFLRQPNQAILDSRS